MSISGSLIYPTEASYLHLDLGDVKPYNYAIKKEEDMPRRKPHDIPEAGKTFRRVFKGETYSMNVVKEGKRIGYKVGGRVFRSPSAAAKSVTSHAVNGWVFWNIERRTH